MAHKGYYRIYTGKLFYFVKNCTKIMSHPVRVCLHRYSWSFTNEKYEDYWQPLTTLVARSNK